MDIKTSYQAAVENEQARWLVHREARANNQSLNYSDKLFVRKHHRDLSKGYVHF